MSIDWWDYLSGILLAGAFLHLVYAYANIRFPSLFGRSTKGNLIHSILLAGASIDVFAFNHGLDAVFNSGLLMGGVDLYLVYLLFGRFMHRRWQPTESGMTPQACSSALGS
ncbi:MAG: hypothetical protein OEZ43_12380 [Gammaproteobacteria bacterium]|nr:hypothetical protein [Gammaproteobacteria bacterium]